MLSDDAAMTIPAHRMPSSATPAPAAGRRRQGWREHLPMAWLVITALVLAGCNRTHFEPPELEGAPVMVRNGGQARLWVLSRQEEQRTVGYGWGHRSTGGFRTDTFYHFRVQAFDPQLARPTWTHTVLTLGDPKAHGSRSRVIGSQASGRMLGQVGDRVWLLVDDQPFALRASDGEEVADVAAIEAANASLKGLLPHEAKQYAFDDGLVFMGADGRSFVLRGASLQAEPYVPKQPEATPSPLKANGMPEIVPSLPFGEVKARLVRMDGQWRGLYTDKEAADAADDDRGMHLRWPYTVLDEGKASRRRLWNAHTAGAQRFEEHFQRLASLQPMPDSPVFLNGRFLTASPNGAPLLLQAPAGVLVWHSTRVDRDGRLALTRLDAGLRPLWTTELPLSETDLANPLRDWLLPGQVVIMASLQTEVDGMSRREPHLVSVSLADGSRRAWNLRAEQAVP